MKNTVLKKKDNLYRILDYTITDEENIKIPNWQKKELDKTERRVQKELKENGFIKTSSVKESYEKTTKLINNLYKI